MPWITKFGLTSWPIRGLPAWVRPYSTKGRREDFVSLSKANEGKTVALIGGLVSCVMTSPAEIARLDLPNANERILDGYNLPNVEKKQNSKFILTDYATTNDLKRKKSQIRSN